MAHNQDSAQKIVDNAVASGGAYEVIRKRLVEQGRALESETAALNQARLAEFGSSSMNAVARIRVRTEHNCIPRDIVQVGDLLLFGYNVFIGLKKETQVGDVFSLFRLTGDSANYDIEPVSHADTFLNDRAFLNDFDELYRYYKHTQLVQLVVRHDKLLASFQIGERLEDIRVFRWSVSADGQKLAYIDNRGERDIELPSPYDFEWVETLREDVVHGKHPHVNILDAVFVETVGGDLTIKVENNTEDGLGIYREPVEDKTQSLDDADIHYAAVGHLILLKVRPYREESWRYLIFNRQTESVLRLDAIGQSCVQLPEDHGVIFPGGYYLQTGEYKTFDTLTEGLRFKRAVRSPNGEDTLYIFYEPTGGVVGLFSYNLIEKTLQNPLYGHGYALASDGRVVIFSAEDEPTRVHPMQIWQTPYVSDEYAMNAGTSQSYLGRIGNAELVRGVSDLYSICRAISNQSVSVALYEDLLKLAKDIFDAHYWLEDSESTELASILRDIAATAELVIDEFEKVETIRQQSAKALQEAEHHQHVILQAIKPENWETTEAYVDALDQLRHQRGHLTTISELRYMDADRIQAMDTELEEAQAKLSQQTVAFLAAPAAMQPYHDKVIELDREIKAANTLVELEPHIASIEKAASDLDLLSELMGTLTVSDANLRTAIIDAISEVYAKLNQSRAQAKHKQKNVGAEEAVAQFGAQFKLFSQSITNALGLATSPERCDEQLSRLLVQLEEFESQFSDHDEFLADILAKREEIYETFESHKQRLLDEQQRKAQSIADAAARILGNIEKRAMKFTEADELNTYFASDVLVLKVGELTQKLRDLNNAVKADEVEARFKAIKDQAARSLRDKSDIYEAGGNVIKLGSRHKFSVNTQELDLTIIPRADELYLHLTGTEYYERIEQPELLALREYWAISRESESAAVYRAEFLAYRYLQQALNNAGLSFAELQRQTQEPDTLVESIRAFAAPRYKEGYEKGVHDYDAALILQAIVPVWESADLLRYSPKIRALAQVFWANLQQPLDGSLTEASPHRYWIERSQSAARMQAVLNSRDAAALLESDITKSLAAFFKRYAIEVAVLEQAAVARYLVEELSRERPAFISSRYAQALVDEFKRTLDDQTWRQFEQALDQLEGDPAARWQLTEAWLSALVRFKQLPQLLPYVPEALALINADQRIDRRTSQAEVEICVEGLLGDHPSIQERSLKFSLDAFLQRLEQHELTTIPAYRNYLDVRHRILEERRSALRLEEFKPRPLSSFVRNRLINELYLPIIGDNFAKQMGTVGENKRTDLMGLLMLISPPGYGKTTLMEYVANRLGLIFMKINCPSLGHDVASLDPQQAPNATARQELEKLNLALEMGNNVMLYLDDIQHTHPEFLQKFISLCDSTRRIEGVWRGNTKTYDLRGKKFAVVMAGNPYTESGEVFKIPDMLANRADIYNLGDVLGGMEEQFALSYIENSLTSNAVLAPLAQRDMADLYRFVDKAKGRDVTLTDMNHHYSGAEVNEIVDVLNKLFQVQDVVLKVNQQYIQSAAQDDKYRTEPSFKLQGSYRNMNKMAEKVSAVMNHAELLQMIADHYLGEAQLLTTGAEENLLKLAELRGNMTTEESTRWAQIKQDFLRNKAMGGDDADIGGKLVAQLSDLVASVKALQSLAGTVQEGKPSDADAQWKQLIAQLNESFAQVASAVKGKSPKVEVINQPVPGMDKILHALAETIDHSFVPVVRSMEKKLDIDLRTHDKMREISEQLRGVESSLNKGAK